MIILGGETRAGHRPALLAPISSRFALVPMWGTAEAQPVIDPRTGQPMAASAVPMATTTATAMPMATATAVPMQMPTAIATAMPMQSCAQPLQAHPVPYPQPYPQRQRTWAGRRMHSYRQVDAKKKLKWLKMVAAGNCCCSLIFLGGLLVPGMAMARGLLSQYAEPRTKYGPLSGLEEQPAPCEVVSVFHRNVRIEHVHHHHHPHHPHHPHNPHGHSPSGRRLDDSARTVGTERHHHTPVQLAHHRHAPTQPIRHGHSPANPRVPRDAHSNAQSTPSTAAKAKPSTEAKPSPAIGAAPRGDRRRAEHLTQAVCYDRFAFAFRAGPSTQNTIDVTGEPLGAMRNRMGAAGWVEVDTATLPNSTYVVLSAPLHTPRACDFTPGISGVNEIAYQKGDYGQYMYLQRQQGEAYAPPSTDIGTACGRSDLSAWYTNPWTARIFEVVGDYWSGRTPMMEWSYVLRAPTAWELGQMGAASSQFGSKQFTGPPTLTRTTAEGECKLPGIGSEELTSACETRPKPSEWASSCPFRVGGTLRCWYAPTPATTEREVLAYHGCADKPTPTPEELNEITLSSVTVDLAGQGPVNECTRASSNAHGLFPQARPCAAFACAPPALRRHGACAALPHRWLTALRGMRPSVHRLHEPLPAIMAGRRLVRGHVASGAGELQSKGHDDRRCDPGRHLWTARLVLQRGGLQSQKGGRVVSLGLAQPRGKWLWSRDELEHR